jgi:hypothetical protein
MYMCFANNHHNTAWLKYRVDMRDGSRQLIYQIRPTAGNAYRVLHSTYYLGSCQCQLHSMPGASCRLRNPSSMCCDSLTVSAKASCSWSTTVMFCTTSSELAATCRAVVGWVHVQVGGACLHTDRIQ